jgi:hypothetical protein
MQWYIFFWRSDHKPDKVEITVHVGSFHEKYSGPWPNHADSWNAEGCDVTVDMDGYPQRCYPWVTHTQHFTEQDVRDDPFFQGIIADLVKEYALPHGRFPT